VRIAVVDYGAGNLTSVCKALRYLGAQPVRALSADALDDCRAVVIPGVGHFSATTALDARWRQAVMRHVEAGLPLLGICLGMQWLFEASEEAPGLAGLALFEGTCSKLAGPVKVPHVGWNTVESRGPSRLLEGMGNPAAYFNHSYAAPVCTATTATTLHGTPFCSVVERAEVFGVQWHPEKSGEAGLQTLRNFLEGAGC
jgi:imidazole glycerol-phosphate synthase subunit HisH